LKIQSSVGAAASGKYVAPTELADFYAGGSTNMPRLRRWKKTRRDDGECAAAGACRFGFDGFLTFLN